MEDAAKELYADIFTTLRIRFEIPERHHPFIKKCIEDYYPKGSLLSRLSMTSYMKAIRREIDKDDWPDVKYVFKAIFVLIACEYHPNVLLTEEKDLLIHYPEFDDVSPVELKLLLQFRNMMMISLLLIDPKNHKGELMTLVGKLCGTVYVTGGGQTPATDRRVKIYERETGIIPRKLPTRRRKVDGMLIDMTSQAAQLGAIFSSAQDNGSDSQSSKKSRFQCTDTKNLLQCADSFWNYHRALLESDQDIPFQVLPVDLRVTNTTPYPLTHETCNVGLISTFGDPRHRPSYADSLASINSPSSSGQSGSSSSSSSSSSGRRGPPLLEVNSQHTTVLPSMSSKHSGGRSSSSSYGRPTTPSKNSNSSSGSSKRKATATSPRL